MSKEIMEVQDTMIEKHTASAFAITELLSPFMTVEWTKSCNSGAWFRLKIEDCAHTQKVDIAT